MSAEKSSTPANPIVFSCPSVTLIPQAEPITVLGVVTGTATQPRVTYLSDEVPVTQEVLDMAAPLQPDAVFRFAGRCMANACPQFDGKNCEVAKRVHTDYEAVVDTLPACRLRPTCRWWHQEGRAACLRCPQVIRLDPIRHVLSQEAQAAPQREPIPSDRTDK